MAKNQYTKDLMEWYYSMKEEYPDLDNPKTFNEKLQWLKIYDATPLKTRLADKYLVRDWIKEKIGDEYLVPLLGVYDKFDDIDFDKLPDQFVMKCNHGSGWNIIVKDKSKLDIADAKQKMDLWMASNFMNEAGYELHYRDIKPKIIIEKFITPEISNHEIQVWVFSGKIKFISVETVKCAEFLERGIFYCDGTSTEFRISPKSYKDLSGVFSKKAFDKAISLVKSMNLDMPYVRVDFIEYNNDVKFREITFTSGSGLSQIVPFKYNNEIGNWIKLPEKAYDLDTKEYYKLPKNYHKKIQKKILEEGSICFKLFNILPILKIKEDMFVKIYSFLGLPLLKRRIISKGKTVKYSILGFPILKISKKL